MFKSLHRIDRGTFWLWAIPIVCGHGLFALAAAYHVQTSLGAVDTGLIVVLAIVLAGRFRDIGWPVWIAPTFLLGTMLVIPMAVLFYMISIGTAGSAFLPALTVISQFSGLANIVLLVLAGSVPGRSMPPGQLSGDDPDGGVDAKQPPTAFEKPQHRAADPLLVAGGGIVALLLIVAIVVGISSAVRGPNAQVTATSVAPTSPTGNGLTKETNDFLRSLAKTSPGSVK
jgi:hypothetical protein